MVSAIVANHYAKQADEIAIIHHNRFRLFFIRSLVQFEWKIALRKHRLKTVKTEKTSVFFSLSCTNQG
jgi:hypothetical protein